MTIKIRKRKQTSTGKVSLYLEYYKGKISTPDGKVKYLRAYKYLNLYLIDQPKSAVDKQYNKDMMQIAETIRAKEELATANSDNEVQPKKNADANFIDYFKALADEHSDNNWSSTFANFVRFAGKDLMFSQIDVDFCKKLIKYWQSKKKLSNNSIIIYIKTLKACINQAVRDEIIPKSPIKNLKIPKATESERNYLSYEELSTLANTECSKPLLKNAFLFSCLTGLRFSDVQKLKWSDISLDGEQWRITFRQKKTQNLLYHYISQEARELLGEQSDSNKIFATIKYNAMLSYHLQKWAIKAGISKKITFHCARHTFATLQLTYGTDIYTLSKMLGHSSIATTQIYAKVIDAKRKEAANAIPKLQITKKI
ncbi:MAG: site-specific integrase [Ignavibacteria bacterium]|jgi:integrase|nr:site-specific integrase [Ignavibacteria bacterium]